MVEIGLILKHVHVKYTETILCKSSTLWNYKNSNETVTHSIKCTKNFKMHINTQWNAFDSTC